MRYRYRIIKNHIKDEQGTCHQTYGIEAYCSVPDISTDLQSVKDLVKRCNRLALTPIHLKDVAEDFVTAEHSL